MTQDWSEYEYHKEQIVQSEKQKSFHVRKMIEECIINQYPREKISAKLKKDLDGLVSVELIQKLCAEAGCTRHYGETQEQPQGQVVDNGDGTVSVGGGEGAPADPTNPVKPKTQERPSDWHPYNEENQIYIDHINRNIELQKEIVKKLETQPFLSKLDTQARKELDEFLYCSGQIMEQTREAWDDRQKIPVSTQIHLARICINESNKHSAAVYIGYVKELFSISAKQIGKTLSGVVRNIDFRYEPNDEQSAIDNGFYGKPCTQCGNFRVKYEHGWLHCFKCEHDEQAKPDKLPKGGQAKNAVELTSEFMEKVNRGDLN